YEASAFLSSDRYEGASTYTNSAGVQAALNASDPEDALNPFAAGAPGTPQLLRSLVASAPYYHVLYDDRMIDGQALMRGPLFTLPAGPLATVFGIESSQEKEES